MPFVLVIVALVVLGYALWWFHQSAWRGITALCSDAISIEGEGTFSTGLIEGSIDGYQPKVPWMIVRCSGQGLGVSKSGVFEYPGSLLISWDRILEVNTLKSAFFKFRLSFRSKSDQVVVLDFNDEGLYGAIQVVLTSRVQ